MTTQKLGISLAVILSLGVLFSGSAKANTPETIPTPLLSQQNQLAYCSWRRVCENRCVAYGGRGYHCHYNRWGKRYCNWGSGYCIRWERYCRNVCHNHYRDDYYWHRW